MGKKMLIGCSGIVAVLALATVAALYVWGPAYGAALLGRPIFVVPPTPERYAAVVLDAAQQRGVYASSPEFARARAAAEDAAARAEDVAEIHDELNAALTAAGGKHSRLLTPEEREDYLTTTLQQPAVVARDAVAVAAVPAHRLEDDSQDYANRLAHGLDRAVDDGACGVVVDLRGNTGGDMGPMLAGLAGLLPDGEALAFVDKHSQRPVIIDGHHVRGGGTPAGVDGAGQHDLPVAVLVDARTASSGEMTMLAFRGLDDVRSFGMPTAGYTSANTVVTMPDGAQLMLTVAQAKDRTGEIFHDVPVRPDEVIDSDPMDKARQWLSIEHGCG